MHVPLRVGRLEHPVVLGGEEQPEDLEGGLADRALGNAVAEVVDVDLALLVFDLERVARVFILPEAGG